MSLLELLLASALMSIMAGAMATMAIAVQQSATYNDGRSAALQHARVAFERINRMITTAYAAPNHPGVGVYVDTLGSYRYPDTLIVWHPTGTPANALGPPQICECIFYSWDPASPGSLIEFSAPSDTRTIPLDSTLQTSSWRATLNSLKTASTTQKTVLTTLLRPCTVNGSGLPSGMASTRGAVRFELVTAPTAANLASYSAGTTTWTNLPWPQGMCGSQFGIREVWVRTELQLMPSQKAGQADPTGQLPLPFFGSATLYYQMTP